jgi:hypothetical protein
VSLVAFFRAPLSIGFLMHNDSLTANAYSIRIIVHGASLSLAHSENKIATLKTPFIWLFEDYDRN